MSDRESYGQSQRDIAVGCFAEAMAAELEANEGKGNWITNQPDDSIEPLIKDLLYHVAKLIVAVRQDHPEGILEYAADVGNEAMFLTDIFGVLGWATRDEALALDDVIAGAGQDELGSKDGSKTREELSAIAEMFVANVDAWLVDKQNESHPPLSVATVLASYGPKAEKF